MYNEAPAFALAAVSERDASVCIRRDQAFALAPSRESRFRVYNKSPGFRPGPRVQSGRKIVNVGGGIVLNNPPP